MSKQWSEWQWNGRDFIAPDGKVYVYGQDDEALDARLNAMQAVVEAAKRLDAMAFKEPKQGHCSHQQHRVVRDDDFMALRTALNQLEAKK